MNELTQGQLKQRVIYHPETGEFVWLKPNGTRLDQVGKRAGSLNHAGYIRITIEQKSYMAHRLAWLYMTGAHPENHVDHINMQKNDNRWINLRAATKSENGANSIPRGRSGLKGAYWSTSIGRWYSSVRGRYIGTFDSAEEANAAYIQEAKKEFGEFART